MGKQLLFVAGFSILAALASLARAAPLGVDGTVGAEWQGITAKPIIFDGGAGINNFAIPGAANSVSAYEIRLRRDDDYVYGVLYTTGGKPASAINAAFNAKFFFDTGPTAVSSADVAIDIVNDQAFLPGGSSLSGPLSPASLSRVLVPAGFSNEAVIEFAVPWSFFMTDPLGMGYAVVASGGQLRLNLSQSFGLSVAGGAASFGADQLGVLTAPVRRQVAVEPAALALLGTGLAAAAFFGRRRVRSTRGR